MASYILERLVWIIPVLFAVSLVTFLLMHSVEGGHWDEEKKLPDAVVQNLNRRYRLDYGMIMGTTLFLAVVIAVANLAVDVAYGLADPRVRGKAHS